MRAMVLLAVGGSLLNFSATALEQTAPFGFSWGPIEKIPHPSFAEREGNITRLVYHHDRLPSTELRDTDAIILEVCKNEGLQQIVWISRVLSASEFQVKFEAILVEGTRRYGKAEITERGNISWSAGGALVARISNREDLHRILMVSIGPRLNICSEEYQSVTGHVMSDQWMRLLPSGNSE